MKEELIKKVQAGTHAIENNGTLEQLNAVLMACFPDDVKEISASPGYYYKYNSDWLWSCETDLIVIKVTEFFEEHTLESLHERIEDLEITLDALKSAFLAQQEVDEKKSKKVKKLEKRVKELEEKLAVINAWNNPTYTVGNIEIPLKKEDLRASLEDRVKDLGLKNIEVNRWTEKRNEGLASFVSVKAYDEYDNEYFIFRHDCKVGENEIIETLRDKILENEKILNKTLEEKLEDLGCGGYEEYKYGAILFLLIDLPMGYKVSVQYYDDNDEIIEKVKKIIEILK